MYSLVVTAKMNKIDPQAWLADVLARIASHPASRIDELLPWNWRAAGHLQPRRLTPASTPHSFATRLCETVSACDAHRMNTTQRGHGAEVAGVPVEANQLRETQAFLNQSKGRSFTVPPHNQ